MSAHPPLVYTLAALVPITSVLALVYAVLPGQRGRLRWVLVLGCLVAVGVMSWAASEGKALLDSIKMEAGRADADAAQSHAMLSQHVAYGTIILLVVVLLVAWTVLKPHAGPTLWGHIGSGLLICAALYNIWAIWAVASAGFRAAGMHH